MAQTEIVVSFSPAIAATAVTSAEWAVPAGALHPLDDTLLEVPVSLATGSAVVVPCTFGYADDDRVHDSYIVVSRQRCVGHKVPADVLHRRLHELWQQLCRTAPGREVRVQLQASGHLLTVG